MSMRDDLDDLDEQEKLAWMIPEFMGLGISRFEADLAGGGDSGDIEDIRFFGKDDNELNYSYISTQMEAMPMWDGRGNFMDYLETVISDDASAEGDWYNNEGGKVESAYIVTENGVLIDYVSITYNPPFDDYDDEELEDDHDLI